MSENQQLKDILKIIAQVKSQNQIPTTIKLVAAVKHHSIDQINQLIKAGVTIVAENTVQTASKKFPQLLPCEKHFIGHLQKNKVRKAIELFDCIQSVDTLELAERINQIATELGKIQNIFLQVNIAEDKDKFGLTIENTPNVLRKVSQLKNVKVIGLMTIGQDSSDMNQHRTYFKKFKQLFDQFQEKYQLKELSMGMSADYEIAVEEGATMVRVGRKLFAN